MKRVFCAGIVGVYLLFVSCSGGGSPVAETNTAEGTVPVKTAVPTLRTDRPATTEPITTPRPADYDEEEWQGTEEGKSLEEMIAEMEKDPYIGFKDGKKVYEFKIPGQSTKMVYPEYNYIGFPLIDSEFNFYYYNRLAKVGLLNEQFQQIVKPDEEEMSFAYNIEKQQGLFIRAGKSVYDMNGKILLDQTCFTFNVVSDQYAIICYQYDFFSSLYGVLNLKTGRIQVPCMYPSIQFLSDQVLAVSDPQNPYSEEIRNILLDLEGNVICKLPEGSSVEWIPEFCGDAAIPVSVGDTGMNTRMGYVDRTGKWIIKPQYSAVNAFVNGYAAVQKTDGQMVLIDIHNKVIKKLDLDSAYMYKVGGESLYIVYKQEKIGFLDENFNILIPFQKRDNTWYSIQGNQVIVKSNNHFLYYDMLSGKKTELELPRTEGATVSEFQHWIGVSEDYKYYDLYDLNGNKLLSGVTHMQETMDHKYIWVATRLYKGYLDQKGNWVYKVKLYTDLND